MNKLMNLEIKQVKWMNKQMDLEIKQVKWID